VEAGFATQVVLNARLTRFYERIDWKRRLNSGGKVQFASLDAMRGKSTAARTTPEVTP
jgi:hypothetical protein